MGLNRQMRKQWANCRKFQVFQPERIEYSKYVVHYSQSSGWQRKTRSFQTRPYFGYLLDATVKFIFQLSSKVIFPGRLMRVPHVTGDSHSYFFIFYFARRQKSFLTLSSGSILKVTVLLRCLLQKFQNASQSQRRSRIFAKMIGYII